MNKMQQRALHYANTLNDVLQKTQEIQEDLNPKFQEIKTALDNDQLVEMASSHYLQIQGDFQHGTDEYAKLTQKLAALKAPAKIMGVHLNLVHSYQAYVQACQQMIDSMKDDRTVDQEAFKASELAQDQATDEMTKCLQRMN
ncbi:hypothetical protein MOO45_06445 [Bombilactobacillus folatiphilus]|uniref:Chemotaxis protein n=1 Tax=Bombilactobacillus folatiphilus TaxID=2923362 RepID=A0ABY4P8B5_9LACO|nr:hypothetical protein [Bombilactobacillus folatiphilus]UQS81835.1 hypothetical protein MOO45_06445 [Bombilactobacillus folatiphilus]